MIIGAFVGVDYTLKKPFYVSSSWQKCRDLLSKLIDEMGQRGSIDFSELKDGFINLDPKTKKVTIVNTNRAMKIASKENQLIHHTDALNLEPHMIDLASNSDLQVRFMRAHINDF